MTKNTRKDNWAAEWVFKKLNGEYNIEKIEVINSNLLKINTSNHQEILALVMSLKSIEMDDIHEILEMVPDEEEIDCLINISTDPMITEDCYEFLRGSDFFFGGFGDLTYFLALKFEDFRDYINKEEKFIRDALGQHDKVKRVIRLDSRRYKLERITGYSDVILYVLNDYDVTAEAVRKCIADYGKRFNLILCNNPNHRTSSNAIEAATSASVKLYSLKSFLGDLHKKQL